MNDDRVTTFRLFLGITWYALKLWWSRTKRFYNEQIRRHFDRYYRVGRHRPGTVGYQNLRWSVHLVAELREDRQLRHHQMLPV
jgi:hypothetical protein